MIIPPPYLSYNNDSRDSTETNLYYRPVGHRETRSIPAEQLKYKVPILTQRALCRIFRGQQRIFTNNLGTDILTLILSLIFMSLILLQRLSKKSL